jgi:hypothetical protein
MAAPLPTRKQTVDLSKGGVRISRIRRDPPPPPPKVLTKAELREREAWMVGIGVVVFAVALFVVLVAINKGPGWSLGDVEITIQNW